MRAAERSARPIAIAALHRRLTVQREPAIPLLVVRLPALERTAWREGLRKARTLERRAGSAFASAAGRVLRAEDSIAHDIGSDVFIAALTAPTRADGAAPIAVDARSALARISASVESATQLEVETGWTVFSPADGADLADAVARGLSRGAQERERYAFFSAIGHELRTPLASIRGYLETLLDDEIDERTRTRFLSIAHQESLRLARLVEGMFEISLLDLHTTQVVRSSGSLDVALDAAALACAANAGARSIALRRAPAVRAVVTLDADRLALVFINLIDNAIKHGRSGGTIAIGADASDPDFACVTIDDDGPGVARTDREHIFGLGTRGKTKAAGSGIGLALVRLMLERAGGRVDVGDSPLGGARFRVYLRHDRLQQGIAPPARSGEAQRAV
ncbi:MAG: HAMP domain-containing sensor histidine kinase [Candidatus Velthaea sp.]